NRPAGVVQDRLVHLKAGVAESLHHRERLRRPNEFDEPEFTARRRMAVESNRQHLGLRNPQSQLARQFFPGGYLDAGLSQRQILQRPAVPPGFRDDPDRNAGPAGLHYLLERLLFRLNRRSSERFMRLAARAVDEAEIVGVK